ncbi:MAG TPA: acyl-CoA dehydrogenase family protein [Chloroflexota bacterium]|nr:acyl-CoA dehydrogenase family protein [Chloroflexota bacterium]
MDFTLPDDVKLLRDTVRDYVRERLMPLTMRVEHDDAVPPDILQEMKDLGLFSILFPEEYGGGGFGELGYCVALEELGAVNAAYSNIIGGHCSLSGMAIALGGSSELKQRYLPEMAGGKLLGAFALTEPNAGSDAAHIQTTARKDGDAYVLNGSKLWVSNGPMADLYVVFATTDRERAARGVSAFVVERDYPGVVVGKVDEKMGLRGSKTSEIFFEDCRVPAENMIGDEGRGFAVAMQTLDGGRVALGASCVGQAQAALDLALRWSQQRIQFGRPISSNQAIQWMLADSEVDIHAGRMMVYHAAWKIDSGQRASHEAAIVKLYCSEMCNRVVDRAVQVHGGMGYMKEFDIERMYRDARILRIYEGTSEVQRMVIAKDLLGGD